MSAVSAGVSAAVSAALSESFSAFGAASPSSTFNLRVNWLSWLEKPGFRYRHGWGLFTNQFFRILHGVNNLLGVVHEPILPHLAWSE